MTKPYAKAEAARVKLAREQADIYENIRRHDGPGRHTTRETFDALIVDARRSSVEDVLVALVDFARPALEHSQLPQEMAAWVSRVGDWHVVFYDSTPSAGSWIEGEHFSERFGELPHYFHVEHRKKDERFDRLVEWTGEELRVLSREHSDYEPFFESGTRVDQNDPWRHLHARVGVGLTELRNAIATGEPRWLICRGIIVLAGVERNAVPVRQRVEKKPEPSPPADLATVLSEAESEWIESFNTKVFSYARMLAQPDLAKELAALLNAKGPKPRTSRVAMSALGMLAMEPESVSPWLQKTSETLRAAAIGALATMDEAARETLVASTRSKKKHESEAATTLLRVLDDPSFRALKAARARVPEHVKQRLSSPDLFAINVQDLDWKEREAERSGLITDAGVALWYLSWMIERPRATAYGTVLGYDGAIALAAKDPLAAHAVALFLLEHPIGDSILSDEPSHKALVARAKRRFGDTFLAAMRVCGSP